MCTLAASFPLLLKDAIAPPPELAPDPPDEPDVLVNIHIPKAGGSYFEANILPHFPSSIPCVSRVQGGRFSVKPATMRCYRSTNSSSEWLWSRNSDFEMGGNVGSTLAILSS